MQIAVNMTWQKSRRYELSAGFSNLSRDKCLTSLAAVGVPRMVSLEPLTTRGAVRVTWLPPSDLCGLTNPQYTIQYGRTTTTPTTHPSMPSSSPFDITGLEVGQEYFVRVAVRTQSGSGTFTSWESVTTYEGKRAMSLHVILWIIKAYSFSYLCGPVLAASYVQSSTMKLRINPFEGIHI